MSETVEVQGLPTPPEGWEWRNEIAAKEVDCLPGTPPERWYYEGRLRLRPIQPATVMVELTREDAAAHVDMVGISPRVGRSQYLDRLAAACRAALASNADIAKPEKCGEEICHDAMGWGPHVSWPDKPHEPLATCTRSLGHGGGHRA